MSNMGNPISAPCDHNCPDKNVCEHECCKPNAEMPTPPQQSTSTETVTPTGAQDMMDALNSFTALTTKYHRGEYAAAAADAERLLLNPNATSTARANCHIIIAHTKQGAARKAHVLAARDLLGEYVTTSTDPGRLSVMPAMLSCEAELART